MKTTIINNHYILQHRDAFQPDLPHLGHNRQLVTVAEFLHLFLSDLLGMLSDRDDCLPVVTGVGSVLGEVFPADRVVVGDKELEFETVVIGNGEFAAGDPEGVKGFVCAELQGPLDVPLSQLRMVADQVDSLAEDCLVVQVNEDATLVHRHLSL